MVSLYEASHGHAAKTTASRNAAGQIVGNSSGSNYTRKQEEQETAQQQQASQQQQTVVISQTYQQQNTALQAQIKAVEQERATENPFQERQQNLTDRTINALKQGYAAGQGKAYSLAGLKAPEQSVEKMSTYSLAQKANALSENIDTDQNKLLSGLPEGTAKDVIKGVSNIPEMTVYTLGNVPLGAESIVRNPKTISDSVAVGAGALAGATVLKAKTHPGELAGELIGAAVLGKAAGKVEAKTINAESLKSFAADDKASIGTPKLIYKAKEPETIKTPEIEANKVVGNKVVGDKVVKERPTAINKISLAEDVKLTPEMEEVLFGKHSTIKQPATELETRNIFSSEMTKASGYEIRSIEQKNEISRVTISEDVKLTPEMEEVLFRKTTGKQEFTGLEARDIFSAEMTKPSKYYISSIRGIEQNKPRNPSIQIPKYQLPSIIAGVPKATQIEISSAFLDSVPLVGQRINTSQAQKTIFSNPNPSPNPFNSLLLPEGGNPDSGTSLDPTPNQNPNPKKDPIIPPLSNPTIDPGINPIIPPISNPIIDPITDPIIDPVIDPTIINQKTIFVSGDYDFLKGFSADRTTHRKTKHKTIKNAYGDPFKTKLKL